MDRTIGKASQQWRVHAWCDCGQAENRLTFADREAGLLWLRQFQADAPSMTCLRSVMLEQGSSGSAPWQRSDGEVFREIARLLQGGVLHVHPVTPAVSWGRDADVAAPAPVRAASSRPAASSPSAPPPAVVQEMDTFTGRTDAAATAAVLRAAAEAGVPFCEECAKRAAARKAA